MIYLFVQKVHELVPYHKHTLEGTVEFPVYLLGYPERFDRQSPIRIITHSHKRIGEQIKPIWYPYLTNTPLSIMITNDLDTPITIRSATITDVEFIEEREVDAPSSLFSESELPTKVKETIFNAYFSVLDAGKDRKK